MSDGPDINQPMPPLGGSPESQNLHSRENEQVPSESMMHRFGEFTGGLFADLRNIAHAIRKRAGTHSIGSQKQVTEADELLAEAKRLTKETEVRLGISSEAIADQEAPWQELFDGRIHTLPENVGKQLAIRFITELTMADRNTGKHKVINWELFKEMGGDKVYTKENVQGNKKHERIAQLLEEKGKLNDWFCTAALEPMLDYAQLVRSFPSSLTLPSFRQVRSELQDQPLAEYLKGIPEDEFRSALLAPDINDETKVRQTNIAPIVPALVRGNEWLITDPFVAEYDKNSGGTIFVRPREQTYNVHTELAKENNQRQFEANPGKYDGVTSADELSEDDLFDDESMMTRPNVETNPIVRPVIIDYENLS